MATAKKKREVAWRIFAREFNSASVDLPGEEQFTPSYILSQLGALINRVYITGVLTECENVGTELEPLWRGRVSDPTDVFYISAGQFQPKAAQMLGELEVPVLVGIVGKTRTYSPDDSTTYVSVRVEEVKTITQELRDYWVVETCESTGYRLGCVVEALRMEPPSVEKLVALGYSKTISTGVIEAINQYDTIDVQGYSEMVITTLKELTHDTNVDSTLLDPEASTVRNESVGDLPERNLPKSDIMEGVNEFKVDIDAPLKGDTSSGNKPFPESGAEKNSEVQEQLVFDIINELVEDNTDGVVYEEVQERAMEHGLDRAVVEEFISSLIDKGMIYEPSIGLLKAV